MLLFFDTNKIIVWIDNDGKFTENQRKVKLFFSYSAALDYLENKPTKTINYYKVVDSDNRSFQIEKFDKKWILHSPSLIKSIDSLCSIILSS